MEGETAEISAALAKEKQISSKLREENAALRKKIGELTRSSESEEEFITNALLKRMNRMREERAQMAVQVEEEEQMTNLLMKRIAELESQVASLKDNEEV